MTIKEEIQIEEYKRTFAEAYKQGFIDAMSVCKTEPQTDIHGLTDCDFCKEKNCEDCEGGKDEPQTEMTTEQIVNELLSIKKILDDGKMPKDQAEQFGKTEQLQATDTEML